MNEPDDNPPQFTYRAFEYWIKRWFGFFPTWTLPCGVYVRVTSNHEQCKALSAALGVVPPIFLYCVRFRAFERIGLGDHAAPAKANQAVVLQR